MFEYSVTPKNSSGNIVEDYTLFVDGVEIAQEPTELEEGEHTIKLESQGLQSLTRDIEVDSDTNQVIQMTPSDKIFVTPSEQTLENVTNEQLARAAEKSSPLIEVDKISTEYVEFYSPEAEFVRLDILENEDSNISHGYEYTANVVVDVESEYKHTTTDDGEKEIFSKQFDSPLRAVREIEAEIREEIDSIW